jgi:hypothetical protein
VGNIWQDLGERNLSARDREGRGGGLVWMLAWFGLLALVEERDPVESEYVDSSSACYLTGWIYQEVKFALEENVIFEGLLESAPAGSDQEEVVMTEETSWRIALVCCLMRSNSVRAISICLEMVEHPAQDEDAEDPLPVVELGMETEGVGIGGGRPWLDIEVGGGPDVEVGGRPDVEGREVPGREGEGAGGQWADPVEGWVPAGVGKGADGLGVDALDVWAFRKYWARNWELIPSSSSLSLSDRIEIVSSCLLILASWLVIFVWAKLICIFRYSFAAVSWVTAGAVAAFLVFLRGGGLALGTAGGWRKTSGIEIGLGGWVVEMLGGLVEEGGDGGKEDAGGGS